MTEEMNVPTVSYLGEQDGVPERKLKDAIVRLLPGLTVHRAYLARVRYDQAGENSVALCLAANVNEQLVNEVARVFSSMFNKECARHYVCFA